MTYKPPPREERLFSNIYIDETSQTKHRYLVIGGLAIPFTHAARFEAEITAARANTIVPATDTDGSRHVMKWQKCVAYNFDVYKTVLDTAINFRRTLPVSVDMGLHCVVVDTSKKPLLQSGEGNVEVGFDKEFHFLCTLIVPKRYPESLFALYADRRHAKRPLEEARDIMNRAVWKYGDRRRGLLRHLEFKEPEEFQALQVTDILIGALAYRLNRHYNKPDANAAKKAMCDYLWQKYKLFDPFNTTPFQKKPYFSWLHRPMPHNPPPKVRQNYPVWLQCQRDN